MKLLKNQINSNERGVAYLTVLFILTALVIGTIAVVKSDIGNIFATQSNEKDETLALDAINTKVLPILKLNERGTPNVVGAWDSAKAEFADLANVMAANLVVGCDAPPCVNPEYETAVLLMKRDSGCGAIDYNFPKPGGSSGAWIFDIDGEVPTFWPTHKDYLRDTLCSDLLSDTTTSCEKTFKACAIIFNKAKADSGEPESELFRATIVPIGGKDVISDPQNWGKPKGGPDGKGSHGDGDDEGDHGHDGDDGDTDPGGDQPPTDASDLGSDETPVGF